MLGSLLAWQLAHHNQRFVQWHYVALLATVNYHRLLALGIRLSDNILHLFIVAGDTT